MIEKIPHESWKKIISASPISAVLTQTRHAVIDPHAPTAAAALGGSAALAIPVGIVVLTFALGFWNFNREAPRIAEQL